MSNASSAASDTTVPGRPVRPRRSVLFVPATNERAMAKVAGLAADTVIFDLEDAVGPAEKDAARENLRAFLKANDLGNEVVVRINPLDTPWGTEDLLAARAAGVDAILVPKVETPAGIDTVASALNETDAPESLRLWAMIETPLGIVNAAAIALSKGAAPRRLDCFVSGPNDIARATGILPSAGRPHLVPLLMQIVVAAKAGGLDILDGVYNDFRDAEGFAAECRQGRAMGFSGKTLIHPAQIDGANEAFGINADAIAEAEKIVAAFESAENRDKGVINMDGRMVERLHRDEAVALLERAALIRQRETRTE